MVNFEKNLENVSEEKLYEWINNRSSRVVQFASDELTRRSLDKLRKSIKKFNKSSSKYSKTVVSLSLILVSLGFLDLFQWAGYPGNFSETFGWIVFIILPFLIAISILIKEFWFPVATEFTKRILNKINK